MFLCWLLLPRPAVSQDSLWVRVIDAVTSEPVPGATLTARQSGFHAVIGQLGEGRWRVDSAIGEIRISAAGYQPVTVTLSAGDGPLVVKLRPLAASLQEVVISGNLRPVRRLESPIPVESYSAHYFKRTCTNSLFDAMGLINGVQPQITCNVCYTGGLQINGLEGPYTMVLIDGMPVMSALATVYGLYGIPNSLVKRIEVVKGPSSTLYGSEAVAGIINIITRTSSQKNEWTFSQSLTSYRESSTDLGYSFRKGRLSGLASVHHFRFTDTIDRNGDAFMDLPQIQRTAVFSRLLLDRKSTLPFSFAMRYIREQRSGGETRWSRRWRGSDSVYGESIDTRRIEVFGNYGMKLATEKLLLEYAYNYHHQDSWYGASPYFARQQTAFAQLRWNRSIGRHYWTAGLPLRFQYYDDNSVATMDFHSGKNLPARNFMAGLFVQDEWKHSQSFTSLLGLRLEGHNLQGPVLAPRLSLKWEAAHNHTLRLTAGNGFRVVNLFTEDHAAISGARQVVIAEALRPERSWNVNLHYAAYHRWADSSLLNMEAGLFYTHFSNRIIPDYDTDPEKIIYSNLSGHVISRGANASLTLTLSNGISAQAGVTLLDVFSRDKGEQKKQLPYVPAFSANYGISYQWYARRIVFDLTARTLSPMRLPVFPQDYRPAFSPWYSILNLQVTHKLGDRLELVAGVQNLLDFLPRDPIMRPFDPFDRHVDDPVTNPYGYTFDPSYNYAPMVGRRFHLGINARFH